MTPHPPVDTEIDIIEMIGKLLNNRRFILYVTLTVGFFLTGFHFVKLISFQQKQQQTPSSNQKVLKLYKHHVEIKSTFLESFVSKARSRANPKIVYQDFITAFLHSLLGDIDAKVQSGKNKNKKNTVWISFKSSAEVALFRKKLTLLAQASDYMKEYLNSNYGLKLVKMRIQQFFILEKHRSFLDSSNNAQDPKTDNPFSYNLRTMQISEDSVTHSLNLIHYEKTNFFQNLHFYIVKIDRVFSSILENIYFMKAASIEPQADIEAYYSKIKTESARLKSFFDSSQLLKTTLLDGLKKYKVKYINHDWLKTDNGYIKIESLSAVKMNYSLFPAEGKSLQVTQLLFLTRTNWRILARKGMVSLVIGFFLSIFFVFIIDYYHGNKDRLKQLMQK